MTKNDAYPAPIRGDHDGHEWLPLDTARSAFSWLVTGPKPMAVPGQLGVSRATAQRYLADLVRRDLLDLSLNYGTAGRPEHRYHVPGR